MTLSRPIALALCLCLATLTAGSIAAMPQPALAQSASDLEVSPAVDDEATTTTESADESAPEASSESEADPIEVSDAELDQVISALQRVQLIQIAYEEQVLSVVEAEGLTPNRFDEIVAMLRSPENSETTTVTDDEFDSFERAVDQISVLQDDARDQVQQAIEDEGLEVDRFEDIIAALNNDTSLQQRFEQRLGS